METYHVIGIMSGTSLDGVDICYCQFTSLHNEKWTFQIHKTNTIAYPLSLKSKLSTSTSSSGLELMLLHNEVGDFIGQSIKEFINASAIEKNQIDFISSHGHTIFHQPDLKLTTQIGNGAVISSITQLPVICDFRTTDISLGGQGAPLVPIGDDLLFSNYDYCINLGGIANVSYKEQDQLIAYDICPTNIILNRLAQKLGFDYDNYGEIARSGNLDSSLLNELNNIDYYHKTFPKSLGIEEIENSFFPILNKFNISIEAKLNTCIEHISDQITNTLNGVNQKVLFTGGGTFNTFLINQIKKKTNNSVIVPSLEVINFKEALIFAFLGVLRWKKTPNCLESVTGSTQNNIGGCVYQAFQ